MHGTRARRTPMQGDSPGSLSVWLPLVALLLDAAPRLPHSWSRPLGASEADSGWLAEARARPTGSRSALRESERAEGGRTEGTRGGSLVSYLPVPMRRCRAG